jgi:uroporphyrinogen-III synthase
VVPTSQGIVESLSALDLRGRRVGLQLYGSEPSAALVAFLRGAGATVEVVAPYVYAPASDDERVRTLVAEMEAGKVDAIAFTSAAQVDRMWQIARNDGSEAALAAALANTRVAAIGPVVVSALVKHGVRIDIAPDKPFVMKHLVSLLAQVLPRP